MNGTRGIALLLLCLAWASTTAAQTPAETRARRQAERQAQSQAQRRGGPARGRLGGQAEASETFTRTVSLERGGTFDLQNPAGDVTITGGDGREARIQVIKRVRALNDTRAQAILQQIKVDIAERGGNVEVRTIRPMGPRGPGEALVDYVVTLPANTNVLLRSQSGNLRVQNMAGDELNLDTLQGNITVSDLRSRMLELHTVIGDMMLRDIAAQRAFVQSFQGNVQYAGPLQRAGRYRLQTHTGDITFIPSGGPGFDLEAMTNRGQFRSDLVLKMLRQPPAAKRQGQIIRGTVGDAGAMLTASSFSGDIVIVKPEGQ